MARARPQRAWRALTAVAVVALQAWLTVHVGVVTHTLGADGALIEVHDELAAHLHDGASLCAGDAIDAGWLDSGPCEATAEFLASDEVASAFPAVGEQGRAATPPVPLVGRTRRLWHLAPKASPPAA